MEKTFPWLNKILVFVYKIQQITFFQLYDVESLFAWLGLL